MLMNSDAKQSRPSAPMKVSIFQKKIIENRRKSEHAALSQISESADVDESPSRPYQPL